MGASGSTAAQEAVYEEWEKRRQAAVEAFEKSEFAAAVPAFAESLGGATVLTVAESKPTSDVVAAKDAGELGAYDKARTRPWNHDSRGYPAVVVLARNPTDVAGALKFAIEHNIPIAVASGAHSPRAYVDSALVIDLSLMKATEVDAAKMTLTAEAGCLLKDADAALKPHALGVPWGTNGGTGLAGLTLAGGAGWLSRMHGFTVDNLIGIDAVLVDGTVIHATKDNEHKDFFWATRGGGGNFGIVTKFYFQAHKLPSDGNVAMYELVYLAPTVAGTKDLIKNASELMKASPDEVNAAFALPCGAPVVPMFWFNFCDGLELGQKVTPPLLEGASKLGGWVKLANSCKVVSYHDTAQNVLAPHQESGFWYETAMVLEDLTPEAIDVLVNFARTEIPNKTSAIVIFPLMGQCQRADPESAAVQHRKKNFWIIIEGKWDGKLGAAGRVASRGWARKLVDALKKLKGTTMTPHVMQEMEDAAEQRLALYGPQTERLAKVKARYDPGNKLALNRNIVPAK